MKIALVAPVEETVPPQKYGGTEWIVYHIAAQIGKRGHTIDLYASGNSKKEPQYNLIPVVDISLREDDRYRDDARRRDARKLLSIVDTVKQINQQQYDIVHNHTGWRFLLFSSFIKNPIVTTHHGPLDTTYHSEIYSPYAHFPHISISNNQRKGLPSLNYAATIYNGIAVAEFEYAEHDHQDAHIAFLARMSPEKGGIEAATVAKQLKKPIRIATKVDVSDRNYFEQFKTAIDSDYITFLHEIDKEERLLLLQRARCLLAPLKWEEPFGLMFTEAMACGTPVVAFARGSVPEVIKDGETGFIVNSSPEDIRGDWIVKKTGIEGLCEAVEKIYNMPSDQYKEMRRKSRAHVEAHFTVEKMVDQYEAVYQQILAQK